MKTSKNIETDPTRRSEYKELQRKRDFFDIANKKISRKALQERNSIFTGIDWSQVKISEQNGFNWQAND